MIPIQSVFINKYRDRYGTFCNKIKRVINENIKRLGVHDFEPGPRGTPFHFTPFTSASFNFLSN